MAAREQAPVILGFPGYREPARRLAHRAGLVYSDIGVHAFPDGESLVRLPENLPAKVIFYCSFDQPNCRLIELELAAGAALQNGAQVLTLVAPYLCYMRQDKAFRPGEAVSQRIIGELLARRFDTLITVDPHLHRTHTLAHAVPVRRAIALSAAPLMAERLARQHGKPLLIGPDAESEQWLSAIAAPGNLEHGVARKQRTGDREVRIDLPGLVYEKRHVVLIDDLVSTGQTLVEAARQLSARHVASISALVSHALFVGDALRHLQAAGIGKICSTDSILHPSNCIHLDGLLADALQEK